MAATSALLTVAGVVLGYPEVVLLGVAGLAAVGVALASLLIPDNLTVDRVVDPVRVVEGGRTSVRLEISNPGRLRSLPAVAQETLGRARATVPVPSLVGGGRWAATVGLPVPDRGRYELPPLVIGHGDPLRLVERRRGVGTTTVLWSHPRTCPVTPLPGADVSDLDGTTSPHSAQGGAAFHSLREYRPGDDPRLIHWASTARTGELVVRHLVVPDETRHLVVLDTCGAAYPEAAVFDDAVRFAASWCVASARAGSAVTIATTSGLLADVEPVENGRPDPSPALDLLADVRRGGPDDTGLSALPSIAAAFRGTAVGVVTGRMAEVDALPALATGAASLSVVSIDPRAAPVAAPRGVRTARGRDLRQAVDTWNESGQR